MDGEVTLCAPRPMDHELERLFTKAPVCYEPRRKLGPNPGIYVVECVRTMSLELDNDMRMRESPFLEYMTDML